MKRIPSQSNPVVKSTLNKLLPLVLNLDRIGRLIPMPRGVKTAFCFIFMVVVIFSYRKAPENPFPAAIDDALEVCRWVLRQGYNPNEIVFAGDSAGGGMTLSLLKKNRELGLPQPAAACLALYVSIVKQNSFLGRFLIRQNILR